ncbi:beta-galactosidase [Shewanella sp. 5_MG-2023]|uniref:beta-galactosidase n=1 Tax=Shewanella sp. 5_MG-2023 TaxID=3062656 RepID=UPI0026E229E6|nr:beta-galactosidase [Shewanella sp. 5_MG-2023]MDO6641656.1 beta-galactosidase [Shewanella sp. 5_MG-2023]
MKLTCVYPNALLLSVLTLAGCQPVASPESQKNSTDNSAPSIESTSLVREQTTSLMTLVDFASADQQTWLQSRSAKFQLLKNQLQIGFLAQHNISTVSIKPEQPWDLSSLSRYNLAFDVANPQDKSVHFYLSVENQQGEYQSRSISIAPHYKGTVFFPLDGREAVTEAGFWGDAMPWKTDDSLMVWRSWRADNVDLTQIAALNFFTIGLLENRSIEIKDIRIRANPEPDPQWLNKIVDQYGQNALIDYPLKITSDEQLALQTAEELAQLNASSGMPNRSIYGGYTKGPKLKATGFFRTEKVDGKWWMVDPQGHVFFSHGPANVRMANMSTLTGIDYKDDAVRYRDPNETTPEDSMGTVQIPQAIKDSRYVASSLRHNMFEWLPEYSDPLAKHYSYRRSTHKGAMPYGETFSFYQANLQRKYGNQPDGAYLTKWHEVTLSRMKDWGFTSFGNWVDPAFYSAKQAPYFANGWIIGDFKTLSGSVNHWGLMPDPFDPEFARRAKITIDEISDSVKDSPWCAGIFIDNEKSWGEREGSIESRYGVILDALSKNITESPAKKAFSEFLQQKYAQVEQLNTAWQTNFNDWDTLNQGVTFNQYSEPQVADLSRLLELLGEQYFKVVHNTLAEKMPNHLYMGARMANWGMPDEIIKASLKYSDVLSFNIYEEGMQPHFWQFLEQVDLPVVIGEFHIGSTEGSGLFNPGIVHASGQQDRANKYKNYMQSVLEKPYMVGAHWFQYVDEPLTGRAFDGENANIGFVTVTDTPYPQLIEAVKEVTSTMYQQRLDTK